MNSLPFISHHLFVAAVGNEAHRQERPNRRDRPFVGPADQATGVPLELLDAREPMRATVARALRMRVDQTQT